MRTHKGAIVAALSVSSSRRHSAWFDVASARATDDEWNTSREAIAERAAIMEFDGALPRDWAERLAAICAGPRPQGCSKTDWPVLCDDVLRFADRYGATLAALGWVSMKCSARRRIGRASINAASAGLCAAGASSTPTRHR